MPTPDDYGQGISLASLTDAPDIPAAIAALANGAIPRSLMRFASAAARTAALTAPVEGMQVWLIAEGRVEIRHNGAWLPWPPIPVQTFQVSDAPFNVTNTLTDYTTGQWPRPTFVVPPSGRAIVTISAGIFNNNTENSTIWAAWRATGSLGFSYSDMNRTGLSAQAHRVVASKRLMLTGLTAGETITLIPQWNISSGNASTCESFGGSLLIEPAP